MSQPLPTVRVKTSAEDNPDGYYLINESEFDPEKHERFEDAPALYAAKHKGGGKFQVFAPSGDLVVEGLSKAEAEAKVAELQKLLDEAP